MPVISSYLEKNNDKVLKFYMYNFPPPVKASKLTNRSGR